MAYQPRVSERQARVNAHVAAAQERERGGIDPALATSREARAATPAPAIGPPSVTTVPPPGPGPRAAMVAPPPDGPPQLKGCTKVEAFPERCKYPFSAIAADGGIWEIDPKAFGVKPNTIHAAVAKWSQRHHYAGTAVTSGGYVYVQFSPVGAGTR